jgi:aminocarboxymuconate-semialdehyde decarboxylase
MAMKDKPLKADVHLHHIPASFLHYLRSSPETGAVFTNGPAGEVLTVGGRWPFVLAPAFSQIDRLLADMAGAAVDAAVLAPIPQLFRYWDEPNRSVAMATVLNDALLDTARQHPGRFWVLAHVPMQAPERAAEELRRAVAAGASGAIIGTDVEGVPLSDERFAPFWQEADHLGCTVFLHPLLPDAPRLKPFYLANLVGNPYETALSAAELIFSGLFDRCPNLRILLAHGGGHLPYQFGRMVKGYSVRPEARAVISRPPQEYLRHLYFDTVLFDELSLRHLIAFAGADHVALGSDYPFGLTTWPHEQTLRPLAALVAEQIAANTARTLMGDLIQ